MNRTLVSFERVVGRGLDQGDVHYEIQQWSGSSIYTLGIITDDTVEFVLHVRDPKHRGDWKAVQSFTVASYGTRRKALAAAKRVARLRFED